MSKNASELYLKMINYTSSSELQDIINRLEISKQQKRNDIALMEEIRDLLCKKYSSLKKEDGEITTKIQLLKGAEQNKINRKNAIYVKYKPIITYARILFIGIEFLLFLPMNLLALIICLGVYLGIEITIQVLKKREFRKFLNELEDIAAEEPEGQKKANEEKEASINQQYAYITKLINDKMQEQEEIDDALNQASYHFDEMQRVIDELGQGLEEPVKLTRKKPE